VPAPIKAAIRLHHPRAAGYCLGGKRRLGPERAPTGLVVGHFTDPEGNLMGVAGTA
jgi:hypothetical protein